MEHSLSVGVVVRPFKHDHNDGQCSENRTSYSERIDRATVEQELPHFPEYINVIPSRGSPLIYCGGRVIVR